MNLKIPSKDITERVVPWISLLFVIPAACFGLYQYTANLRHNQVRETLELVEEYRTFSEGTSIQSSLRLLRDAGKDVTSLIGGYYEPGQSSEAKKKIRQEIINAWNDEIKSQGYENNVLVILDFFINVTLCVDGGVCDEKTALHYFGSDMFSFINRFCGYLDVYAKEWNREQIGDEIFWFVFNNNIHKKVASMSGDREKYFFCERHRRYED